MLSALQKLHALLAPEDVRRIGVLFIIIVVMALLEIVGIASVLPFLYLAADPAAIEQNQWLGWVYEAFGFDSHRAMLVACGWCVIGFLTMSNMLAAASVWQRQRIAWSIAHSVSMKLVRAYTSLPYEFFLTRNSSDLIRKIISDVNNLVTGVLLAGGQFLSQLIVSCTIFSLLLVIRPWVAISALTLFAGIYIAIYATRRKYLRALGRDRLDANYTRYKTFVELITGIKTVKSDGATPYFIDRFESASRRFSDIHPKVHFTSSVPRYFVQTLVFGSVVGVILYLATEDQDLLSALPTLTLFALAGYRLMPAINGAYAEMTQILSSYPAIESIHEDIHAAENSVLVSESPLAFQRGIELRDVSFRYRQSEARVLDGVSLEIGKGEKVAFVGPTGSGKTTLIDILMGLLPMESGQLLVDDLAMDDAIKPGWQRIIGYVPQEVFLYDDTVARNIAFGDARIDDEKLRQVCDIAQLRVFIEQELPRGYQTEIGERGVRLSGGQRQRLGMARALYRLPQVLVMDEATSALDSATEDRLIHAIHERLPGVTIVMIAHRISTVRRCDRLFLIDRGRLAAHGAYEELLTSNKLFRELARFA